MTGVQTCALPIWPRLRGSDSRSRLTRFPDPRYLGPESSTLGSSPLVAVCLLCLPSKPESSRGLGDAPRRLRNQLLALVWKRGGQAPLAPLVGQQSPLVVESRDRRTRDRARPPPRVGTRRQRHSSADVGWLGGTLAQLADTLLEVWREKGQWPVPRPYIDWPDTSPYRYTSEPYFDRIYRTVSISTIHPKNAARGRFAAASCLQADNRKSCIPILSILFRFPRPSNPLTPNYRPFIQHRRSAGSSAHV